MSAAIYHWKIDQGATEVQPFVYQPGGVVADLTGWSARMMIRAKVADASPLLSLTSPSGGIVITAATGTVTVTLTAAQTAALAAGVHVYDLEIVAPDTRVVKMMRGTMTVRAEVTR